MNTHSLQSDNYLSKVLPWCKVQEKPVRMQPFRTSAFEETMTNHENNGRLILNTEYVVLQPAAIRIFHVQWNYRSVHTEVFL